MLERPLAAEIDVIEAHLALLSEMGCAVMVFAEVSGSVAVDRSCPLSARPRLDASDWRDFGAVLTRLAEHCAGSGVRIAYHHHMGTVIESEDENDRLMAATGDAVGLLLTSIATFLTLVTFRHMGELSAAQCRL